MCVFLFWEQSEAFHFWLCQGVSCLSCPRTQDSHPNLCGRQTASTSIDSNESSRPYPTASHGSYSRRPSQMSTGQQTRCANLTFSSAPPHLSASLRLPPSPSPSPSESHQPSRPASTQSSSHTLCQKQHHDARCPWWSCLLSSFSARLGRGTSLPRVPPCRVCRIGAGRGSSTFESNDQLNDSKG
ncbi:hypothetical protein BKA81DRAFT_372294 [Phyllosticta paracitricarpa]